MHDAKWKQLLSLDVHQLEGKVGSEPVGLVVE
jgi:hypothetical protein